MGGFRQAFMFMEAERQREINLASKQRGIIRKMSDSTYRLLGAALNQLKHNSNWNNILLKKTLLKMTDSAYRDQAAGFRILLHNHREAIKEQAKRERILRGTCNKFRDGAYRLGADALRILVAYWMKKNKSGDELKLRKEAILKRIIDIDNRLMGM